MRKRNGETRYDDVECNGRVGRSFGVLQKGINHGQELKK
jgi:hypothetical protein